MKLYDILLPREGVCTETALFYKVTEGTAALDDGCLCLQDGAAVSFESFFNCFSAPKYLKYCGVDSVTLNLDIDGCFDVTAEAVTYGKRKTLLSERLQRGSSCLVINTKDCPDPGYISFKIAAIGEGKLYGGRYLTEKPDFRKTKIGIAICTYRREKYVMANLERICKFAETEPHIKELLHVFVVDNGGTLDKTVENDMVTLIKNPNLGGSGGFSRGMYEIYTASASEGYTHMLLMDDDVAFFPETLYKTYAFLSSIKEEFASVSVGAGMMRLDKPYHQHEFGAMWTGWRVSSFNNDCDLRKVSSLIANERLDNPPYSAWWYMCMPVEFVKEHGLSLPFFIKGDDVEYSLRACKVIVMLNGIGVWHEAFNLKCSAELEYYAKRNEAVISAVYSPQHKVFSHFRKLLRATAFQLVCQRYGWAEMYFRAYNDFLKGADYLNSVDMEALHKELRSHNAKTLTKAELIKEFGLDDIVITALDKMQSPRLLRYTLNGYLIPRIFYRFCHYNRQGVRVVDSTDLKQRGFFCADRVIFYNPYTETGYVTKQNKGMLFKYGFKLVGMLFKLIFFYRKAAKTYIDNLENLTSIDNWKSKMKIT